MVNPQKARRDEGTEARREGKEGKGKEPASKRETHLPENFSISENVKEWADKNGHDQLELHLAKFIDTAKAKGYKYIDWDAAFRNAISGNWAKVTPKQGASVYVMPEFMRGAL